MTSTIKLFDNNPLAKVCITFIWDGMDALLQSYPNENQALAGLRDHISETEKYDQGNQDWNSKNKKLRMTMRQGN